jgi:hypothetical protein
MDDDQKRIELLKECNATIRQWETLLFGTVKDFLSFIAYAIGAAGTVVIWSGVVWSVRQGLIRVFLLAAFILSLFAYLAVTSQHAYLATWYARRTKMLDLTQPNTSKRNDVRFFVRVITVLCQCICHPIRSFGALWGWLWPETGWTVRVFQVMFLLIAVGAAIVWWSVVPGAARGTLAGARLQGADLSMVVGLTQADLEGACGDHATKLPEGMRLLRACH